MILLDIAKAFNCVSHEILYAKMASAGFDKTVIQWFRSYLHRTQQVSINNRLSSIIPVSHGIAQGTVLGPMLFIFYINDIFECTKYVKMSLFADDCVMFLSRNNWNVLHRRIQRDFDPVIDLTLRNNLRLNHDKTNAIIFGSRFRLSNLRDPKHFSISDKKNKFVNSHSYLGVLLDSTMSLTPLAKSVKKWVTNKVFMLCKIRKYVNFDASLSIYKQTILPIIDYSGFLLLACKQKDLDALQKIQNDVLRICVQTKLAERVSLKELHKKCKIIGLKQRMQRQLLWLMYIISHDEKYLRSPTRETRSAQKVVFRIPAKILPVYEHSPYYQGSNLWNGLDKDTQKKDNVFAFKKDIDKLFKFVKPL